MGRDKVLLEVIFLRFIRFIIFFLKRAGIRCSEFSNHFYPFIIDGVSYLLVSLCFLVIFLSLFSGHSHVSYETIYKYYGYLLFIFLVLLLLFFVRNYIIFFILFEFIIMPMVFVIGTWRSQMERLTANYYFFFYALIRRIPLMLSIIFLIKQRFSFLFLIKLRRSFLYLPIRIFLCISLAFLCKLPIYRVHIWLPKAHVEAPVRGSILLARLLLKIRGYGVFRMLTVVGVTFSIMFHRFIGLLFLRSLYPIFICIRQVDLKSFIAYSSVSHMAVALMGLIVYNYYGILGGLLVFLRHRIISPIIFYSANLIYERINSRILIRMGRFEVRIKNFFYFFILCFIANIGYPPFVSFFRELSLYIRVVIYNIYALLYFFIFILFSRVVIIYFLVKVFKRSIKRLKSFLLKKREILIFYIRYILLIYITLIIEIII